jgi:hypothetical protein
MNVEEHIKLVNRKKARLKEELTSHMLNYYTWKSPSKPKKQTSQSVIEK